VQRCREHCGLLSSFVSLVVWQWGTGHKVFASDSFRASEESGLGVDSVEYVGARSQLLCTTHGTIDPSRTLRTMISSPHQVHIIQVQAVPHLPTHYWYHVILHIVPCERMHYVLCIQNVFWVGTTMGSLKVYVILCLCIVPSCITSKFTIHRTILYLSFTSVTY
jgi:hypothetical protein